MVPRHRSDTQQRMKNVADEEHPLHRPWHRDRNVVRDDGGRPVIFAAERVAQRKALVPVLESLVADWTPITDDASSWPPEREWVVFTGPSGQSGVARYVELGYWDDA